MSFYARPFLVIAPILCLGIILEDTFRIQGEVLIGGLVGTIVLVLFLQVRNLGKDFLTVLLLFSLILLGGFAIHEIRDGFSYREYNPGEASYLVQVDEISDGKGEWRKSICSIQKEIRSGVVNERNERALLILNAENVLEGDVLMVHTEISSIRNKNNPAEFDSKSYWNNQNIYNMGFVSSADIRLVGHNVTGSIGHWFESIQAYLSSVLHEHLEGANLSIAQALILGDKSLLSKENRDSFSKAGAMHVLAVSGLHVGIILYILIFIFRQFPRYISGRNASLIALLLIWIYAGITGFSPSVLRASFMFSMLVLGQLLSKRTDTLNILFFTAFVLLLLNPLLIYNIGFQLSYLAMIGILLLYKPISAAFWIKNKWLQKIWEGTAVGIAAQIVTVPLTLYYFHQFPNYFALSNLFVMLSAGVILGMGLLLFLFHPIGLIGQFFGVLLGLLLSSLLFVVQYVEVIPGSVAYGFQLSEGVLLLTYVTLFLLLFFELKKYIRLAAIACLLLVFIYVQYVRYENHVKNELVVFNASQFTAAVKIQDQIVCAHAAESEENGKYKRLMEAYQKMNPGMLKYVELQPGITTVEVEGEKFVFKLQEGSVEILCGAHEIFVRTSYRATLPADKEVIEMPYLESSSGCYNLKDGAFIMVFDRST